jgi:hypothetical protein
MQSGLQVYLYPARSSLKREAVYRVDENGDNIGPVLLFHPDDTGQDPGSLISCGGTVGIV